MFEAIKSFVAELADGNKTAGTFGDSDYRLAFAALLVHAASVDGEFSETERGKLIALLKQRFDLDDAQANELIEKATVADQKAVDLYHFTHLLKRHTRRRRTPPHDRDDVGDRLRGRRRIGLRGQPDLRVADLLGVSSTERIALRQRVAAARGSNT